MRREPAYIFVYALVMIIFLITILRWIEFFFTQNITDELFLTSSLIVSVVALFIRFLIVKEEDFSSLAKYTKDTYNTIIYPARFFNLMPLAMIVCTISDFLIKLDFLLGMISFMAAQAIYIIAYSGIMSLKDPLMIIRKNEKSRLTKQTIAITIFWGLLPILTYITLLYDPNELITLAIIPYIVILTLMVYFTYIHFIKYTERSIYFRFFLLCGATWFFISDAILAINRFTISIPQASLWIGTTYILAAAFLQLSILFLIKIK